MEKRRVIKKMNKKLVALLIPLMLISMASFGYAHWSDSVTKKYKLHSGTVEIDIIQWHIDKCTSYDVNCNKEVYGDEIQVFPIKDPTGQVIDLHILADPIFPCWELEFKMLVHNKGRLAVRFEKPTIVFKGPYDAGVDPCWDPITGGIDYDWDKKEFPGIPWFEYICLMYKHDDTTYPTCPKPCTDKSHYTIPADPTEYRYKPCECIMIKQWLHLKQAALPDWPETRLQEYLQCRYLRIDFEIKAINEVGTEWGSVGQTYP